MDKFFSEALKVKNIFGVAVFSLILLYLFRDTIRELALAGDSENLNLLLAFLFFSLLSVLGVTGYYAIAKAEINKGNVAVTGSKKVATKLKGGGSVDVRDSEDVNTEIDNSGSDAAPEKKT